jgi:hypothetical protein
MAAAAGRWALHRCKQQLLLLNVLRLLAAHSSYVVVITGLLMPATILLPAAAWFCGQLFCAVEIAADQFADQTDQCIAAEDHYSDNTTV